jgi:hypothetical protein
MVSTDHFHRPTKAEAIYDHPRRDPGSRFRFHPHRTPGPIEIDEGAWATPYREVSRPFDWPTSGRIAVKVINHFGTK